MPRHVGEIPRAWWTMAMAPGLGPVEGRRLLDGLGSAEAVLQASEGALAGLLGPVRGPRVHAALAAVDVEAEWRCMQRLGVRALLPEDVDWPELLRTIPGAPLALWVRGAFAEADRFSVAVVGSRTCTGYGLEQADRFAGWLAAQGFTVVSGGARGIDAAGHRAALRHGGRTVAVLAGGLGVPYPPEHVPLYDEIVAAGGCVCSEFPCMVPSEAGLFPRRNRIISGLSLGTLLIEARQASGALITARLAAEEHGREVMAVPGRIDSPASAGCHRAIREGWASLVTGVADVSRQLRSMPLVVQAAATRQAEVVGGPALPAELAAVLQAIRQAGRVDYDAIAAHTGLGVAEAMAAVTRLELAGVRLRPA